MVTSYSEQATELDPAKEVDTDAPSDPNSMGVYFAPKNFII